MPQPPGTGSSTGVQADLEREASVSSGIAVPAAFYKILLEDHAGKPRVFSVIMPVYNPPVKILKLALDSVLTRFPGLRWWAWNVVISGRKAQREPLSS